MDGASGSGIDAVKGKFDAGEKFSVSFNYGARIQSGIKVLLHGFIYNFII